MASGITGNFYAQYPLSEEAKSCELTCRVRAAVSRLAEVEDTDTILEELVSFPIVKAPPVEIGAVIDFLYSHTRELECDGKSDTSAATTTTTTIHFERLVWLTVEWICRLRDSSTMGATTAVLHMKKALIDRTQKSFEAEPELVVPICFLGHLFANGFVVERVVHFVGYKLLYGRGIFTQAKDNELRNFVILMRLVGPHLVGAAKKNLVPPSMNCVRILSENHADKQIRLLMIDLLELYENGWRYSKS